MAPRGKLITGTVSELLGTVDQDDEAGAVGGGRDLPPDPARVVTDVTRDPRGASFENQPTGGGPAVLPPEGPPVGLAPKAAAVRQLRGAPTTPPAPAPVLSKEDQELSDFLKSIGQDPGQYGIAAAPSAADIPLEEPEEAPQPQFSAPAQSTGDVLERSKAKAYALLSALPPGCELFVGGTGSGPAAVELAMGLGVLIGSGLAVYRGDGHYRLKSPKG